MTKRLNWKAIIALLLVAAMALPLFACEKDQVPADTHIYENRYENKRYYYSQGYPEDWTVSFGENDYELATLNLRNNSQEGVLCAKLFPLLNTSDVSYTIYKYNTKSMMNTLNGISANIMNSNSDYFLNDVFVEDGLERNSFVFTSDGPETEYPNRFQFHTADYSFVRDGEDWKGKFYVSTCNSTWFFLICMEAKRTEWDSAYSVFSLMIQDFGFEGFEKTAKK